MGPAWYGNQARVTKVARPKLGEGSEADALRRSIVGAEGVAFRSLDPGDMDTPLHALAVPDADRTTLRRPENAAAEIVESQKTATRLGAGFAVERPADDGVVAVAGQRNGVALEGVPNSAAADELASQLREQ